MSIVDFHVHTVCSNDAYMELARIAPAAKAAGVIALAVTDHDRVAGVKPLREYCRREGVSLIAGVEVDSDDDTGRFDHIHFLGLGIDEDDSALNALLDREVLAGRQRLEAGIRRLAQELGKQLDSDVIRRWWTQRVPYREIGPKTVADYLAAEGIVSDRAGALKALTTAIAEATPDVHVSPPCRKVIDTIHAANGLAVLAHPQGMSKDGIRQFVQWGIDGLEVYHKLNVGNEERLLGIAAEFDLAVTGGGDSHDPVQQHAPGTWPSTAPGELYQKLLDRYRRRFGRDPEI